MLVFPRMLANSRPIFVRSITTSANLRQKLKETLDKELTIRDVVNLDKYPLLQPNSKQYQLLIQEKNGLLQREGVVTLPQFLKKEALEAAVQEVEEKQERSYSMTTDHNIYLKDSNDTAFHKSHVRNRGLSTKVAALACDEISESSPLKIIFRSNAFKHLIQSILGFPQLHRNIDPVGACFVNIYHEGFEHNWHFDESHWSTTILLQDAKIGGHFEYTEPFRMEDDETQTHPTAEKVLAGDETLIKRLEFAPGTVSIFQGRRSLHRVTKCEGDVRRLLGVLHFSQKPGVRNSPGVQQLFWGKVVQDREYIVNPQD